MILKRGVALSRVSCVATISPVTDHRADHGMRRIPKRQQWSEPTIQSPDPLVDGHHGLLGKPSGVHIQQYV
jgi:hypothetical protein